MIQEETLPTLGEGGTEQPGEATPYLEEPAFLPDRANRGSTKEALSRRGFFGRAAGMMGACSVAGLRPSKKGEPSEATRRFGFFLWNDMHVRDPQAPRNYPGYPFANEKAQWALECAQGQHGLEPPDFVLSGGDIIDGELEDYHLDFAYLQSAIIDRLPVPFLPCVGNHENGQGEGILSQNVPYDQAFGADRHNYAFTYGGIAFLVVDTSGAHRQPDAVTAARNAFVEGALAATAGWPVLVVTHVPLIAMREEEPLKASFGFSSWRVLDTRMLELIEAQAERVIAVLCGHLHLTSVRQQKGIFHIMPAGTCGYPSDFASFDVFRNHLRVHLHRAPEKWLDRRGNIHGRPRHPHDYTDREHPDHESYVWGNAEEREVTIPLTGLRRPEPDAPRSFRFVPV